MAAGQEQPKPMENYVMPINWLLQKSSKKVFPCHNEEVSDILDKCSFNTGIVSWHTGRVPESQEMCNGYCSNFIIIQWWPLICLTKTLMQVCSKLF